jgi:hypothetical protein
LTAVLTQGEVTLCKDDNVFTWDVVCCQCFSKYSFAFTVGINVRLEWTRQ